MSFIYAAKSQTQGLILVKCSMTQIHTQHSLLIWGRKPMIKGKLGEGIVLAEEILAWWAILIGQVGVVQWVVRCVTKWQLTKCTMFSVEEILGWLSSRWYRVACLLDQWGFVWSMKMVWEQVKIWGRLYKP